MFWQTQCSRTLDRKWRFPLLFAVLFLPNQNEKTPFDLFIGAPDHHGDRSRRRRADRYCQSRPLLE
jgi:hypothetical protein